MDNAEDKLMTGLAALKDEKSAWERRQGYYEGDQDLPSIPDQDAKDDPNLLALRDQSPANWLCLAMDGPVQRLATASLREIRSGKVDPDSWNDVWLTNDLESRSKIVQNQMMVHGRGIYSVSKIKGQPGKARVLVENCKRVYLHRNPENPFEHTFAVKTWAREAKVKTSLYLSPSAMASVGAYEVGVVYDATSWVRFVKPGGLSGIGGWTVEESGDHGLGELPFVESPTNVDADGKPRSAIENLMAAQDAVNTIRFYSLRAMSSAAFRQKIITGFDPRVRDAATGEPIYLTNKDGSVLLDPHTNQPIPLLQKMGRMGVDRTLMFPGTDTKIGDLAESSLSNYTGLLEMFLTDLLARGQVPPQYALNKMANLSGDALSGAEATLQSLIGDLKRESGTAITKVMRLANRARGKDLPDLTPEWADTEPKSFAQIVDGVVKLITADFPRRPAFEMLPGATPTKVDQWMELYDQEQTAKFSRKLVEQFTTDPDEPAPAGEPVTV